MVEDHARVRHRSGVMELLVVVVLIAAVVGLVVMSAGGIADAVGEARETVEESGN